MSEIIEDFEQIVKRKKRMVVCDYCGYKTVKPDQRETQIIDWAKIKIKRIEKVGHGIKHPLANDKIVFDKFDMCPECVKKASVIGG